MEVAQETITLNKQVVQEETVILVTMLATVAVVEDLTTHGQDLLQLTQLEEDLVAPPQIVVTQKLVGLLYMEEHRATMVVLQDKEESAAEQALTVQAEG